MFLGASQIIISDSSTRWQLSARQRERNVEEGDGNFNKTYLNQLNVRQFREALKTILNFKYFKCAEEE